MEATATGNTHKHRLLMGLSLLVAIGVLFFFTAPYLSLEYLDAQRALYENYYAERPALVVAIFVAVTALTIGLSLPTTAITLLLAGALFKFPLGALVGGAACTLGALLGFLWSRYLFRGFFEERYEEQLEIVNRGVQQEGWFYVFGLRLVMVFPSFLVNMLCALTSLKATTYFSATLASQLIVGSIWAYAGSQLAKIQEGADLLSIELFLSLMLIGIAPLAFKRLLGSKVSDQKHQDT